MELQTYQTERMLIVPPTVEYFPQVYHILQNPKIMRYVTTGPRSFQESWNELNGWIDHWQMHGFGPYFLLEKERQNLIVFAKLYLNNRSPYLQMGYALDTPYWGYGLGTEAANFCLQIGFNKLNQRWVDAYARVENHPSRHILEKIGMRCANNGFVYSNRTYARYLISKQQYLQQQGILRAS